MSLKEAEIIGDLDADLIALRKAETEERLEKVALDGLCNIYHAITGKTCERYVSLGMATSAVSALLQDKKISDAIMLEAAQKIEEQREEIRRLKAHIADLNHDFAATIQHCNKHHVEGREI